MQLDIRGKRSDEAVAELSQFLDQALLSGFEEVEIIHGKGTGALRGEVHSVLKRFPGVSDFTLAPADRGGDGMTLVHFG
jgi:DNA mismatch repair protein MutS2